MLLYRKMNKNYKQWIVVNKTLTNRPVVNKTLTNNVVGSGQSVHQVVVNSSDTKETIQKTITKDIIQQAEPADNINPLIKEFEVINPTINYGNTTQRNALKEMIKQFGYDKLLATIKFAVSIQGKPYSPTITTPCQLKENMGKLLVYYKKEEAKKPLII